MCIGDQPGNIVTVFIRGSKIGLQKLKLSGNVLFTVKLGIKIHFRIEMDNMYHAIIIAEEFFLITNIQALISGKPVIVRVGFRYWAVSSFIVSEVELGLVIAWYDHVGNFCRQWFDLVHPDIGVCTIIFIHVIAHVSYVQNEVNLIL